MARRPLRQFGEQHLRLAVELVHGHGKVVRGDGPLGVTPAGRAETGLVPPPRPVGGPRSSRAAPDQENRFLVDLPEAELGQLGPGQHQGAKHPGTDGQGVVVGGHHRPAHQRERVRHEQAAEGHGEAGEDQSQRVDGVVRQQAPLPAEQQPGGATNERRRERGPPEPDSGPFRRSPAPHDPIA